MIQSQKDPRYFRLPELFGFSSLAGPGMIWGKRNMIEFLMKLEHLWTTPFDNVYEQISDHGNFAKIALGDISRDGGGPSRRTAPRFHGHKSHRCGVDIDIFVIGKSGLPNKGLRPIMNEYDFERTSELATAILSAGGNDITDIFIGDKRLVALLGSKKPKQTRIWQDTPQHDNHFHIRLKNNDKDPMCLP